MAFNKKGQDRRGVQYPYDAVVPGTQIAPASDPQPDAAQIHELPKHLFPTEDASTVELTNATLVLAGATDIPLITYQAQQGSMVRLLGYAFTIYNPAIVPYFPTSFVFLVPRINGKRIFAFHGDPAVAAGIVPNVPAQRSIYTPTGPDITTLFPGLAMMQPGDVLTWSATNLGGSNVQIQIRQSGYADRKQLRTQRPNFG